MSAAAAEAISLSIPIETVNAVIKGHVETAIKSIDFEKMGAEIKENLYEVVKESQPEIEARIIADADKKIQVRALKEIKIVDPKGHVKDLEGFQHNAFERVLQLACMRKPIFLPGPAGCGKSHMAEQIAEALGVQFGFISCSVGMSESQLLGRLIPQGESGSFEYAVSRFVECYEDGGVFLMDEMDAADPNVLLVVNSALANGKLSIPARVDKPVAERHEDFVFIAAANTFGRGADRQYVGRNELDEATLDRFRIGTVPMDYDYSLESALCPWTQLRQKLQKVRRACESNRLERIISTRFLKDAFDMVKSKLWKFGDVEDALFSGWTEDEVSRVKKWVRDNPNCLDDLPADESDQSEYEDLED